MARMPGAEWLGEHSPKRPMSRYDIVCVHTIVGYAPAHAAHFSVHDDGRIVQSRDTRYQSGANLHGNPRIIAIENEDGGEWWEPLTDAQVAANAWILAWAHIKHGVPLQLCPDSKRTSQGLAYHRQGIDGNFDSYEYGGRVKGGELWTNHYGKVCPGDAKIAQLPEILRQAQELVEGDDMSWNEKIEKWAPGSTPNKGEDIPAFMQLNQARGYAEDAYDGVKRLNTRVNKVDKRLDSVEEKADRILALLEEMRQDG